MKKFGIVKLILISLVFLSFTAEETYRIIPNSSFERGEFLRYRAHYGFITAGGGSMTVHKNLYNINNRVCYRIDTRGYTSGTFRQIVRVEDLWRSYIDTTAFVSQKFYRHIEENKYRKDEEVFYDHKTDKVRVVDKKRKIDKKYDVPDNAQDMISGYYYLRNVNFHRMNILDTVTIPGFVENESYELDLVYRGKAYIKNKLGKFKVLKLTPVMPENEYFNGENSLRIYVTDDLNRIPVKIEADMFVGSFDIDLEEFSGVEHPVNMVAK